MYRNMGMSSTLKLKLFPVVFEDVLNTDIQRIREVVQSYGCTAIQLRLAVQNVAAWTRGYGYWRLVWRGSGFGSSSGYSETSYYLSISCVLGLMAGTGVLGVVVCSRLCALCASLS